MKTEGDEMIVRTKRLGDSVVVVAGGSGSIGNEVCQLLSGEGARVVSIRSRGRESEQGPNITTLQADLRSLQEWRRVLRIVQRRYGTPDVLINCAGVLIPGTVTSLSPNGIRTVLETNLTALLYGIRSVLPAMEARGSGHLITVGSLGGILPMPYEALYSATKFAVRGFCLSLAEELRDTGVHSTLISVGPVKTAMLSREALDEESVIAFMTRPIDAGQVAKSILAVLSKPRTEVLLPVSAGITATFLALCPGIFGICYRMLRPLGKRRQNRYLKEVHKSSLALSNSS